MPWDDSPGGGFSAGKPWLRIPDVHRPRHAAGAEADENSIFHGYAALLTLRRKVKSLVYGDLTPLTESGEVIAFRRGAWQGHPAVTVLLNWSGKTQPWPVAMPSDAALFANRGAVDPRGLRPWEALIFPA